MKTFKEHEPVITRSGKVFLIGTFIEKDKYGYYICQLGRDKCAFFEHDIVSLHDILTCGKIIRVCLDGIHQNAEYVDCDCTGFWAKTQNFQIQPKFFHWKDLVYRFTDNDFPKVKKVSELNPVFIDLLIQLSYFRKEDGEIVIPSSESDILIKLIETHLERKST